MKIKKTERVVKWIGLTPKVNEFLKYLKKTGKIDFMSGYVVNLIEQTPEFKEWTEIKE